MAAKMVYTNDTANTIIASVLSIGTIINQCHKVIGVGLLATGGEVKVVYQINPGRQVDNWFGLPKWEFDQDGEASFVESVYNLYANTWYLQERSREDMSGVRWLNQQQVEALQRAHEGRELLAQVAIASRSSML